MLRTLLHLSALGLCAALGPAARVAPRPFDAADTAVREELFVLELERAPAADRPGPQAPEEVGVALLRRRLQDGVEQAEWDIRFFEDGTRVSHVERWSSEQPRLVWREWRPGAGRTLKAELGPTGVELVEWGSSQCLRTLLPAAEGALFPLYFLELARAGELAEGLVPWFDPLARAVEPVAIELDFGAELCPDSRGERVVERRVELRRGDGTSAGQYVFRGSELHAFRWQAGDLAGRRVERAAYDERLGRCERPEAGELVER